ncbi:DUF2723 domain-containing protein [Flavobacteriaceae bacterium Ap0902]|nr:DUF2723 domain-containing protein [Flavobacteriaceae bacterium Ap0902]
MGFKKLNNILGWVMFIIAAMVYLLTMEREFSFWDTGEYIVSSAKLSVTHAPGAAFFQLVGAVWSGLAFGDGSKYGILINAMSAICSALTILFLFWTITHLARRIIIKDVEEQIVGTNKFIILLSGIVGAAAYMFSDSFWFSAVEGEVYAMASMFTALMLWLACKWENDAGKYRENRWVLLIALLVGLATGVHLMAILVIPALCYIYYFRHYDFTWKSFAIANVITAVIFVFVFKFIFSFSMTMIGKLEVFMVNELDMPFNSGFIVTLLIFAAVFYFGLSYTRKKGHLTANTFILATLFMLVGFSSWLVIPIRANANPHMNLNDPDDAIGLLDYFNREQYGDWPVFTGPLYTAHIDPNGVETNPDGSYKIKDNGPILKKNEKKGVYEEVGRRTSYVYNPEHIGLFARMYNPMPDVISNYKAIMGEPDRYEAYNPVTGEQEIHYIKPSLWQNIQFFLDYQVGYMYLRYLGWNFIGKQNDFEGNLEVTKGNTITGITFIDNWLVGGNQGELPSKFKDNEARNVYFAIPFILGIVGFFFQLKRDPGRNFALISLFLLTGVGIVLYTNVKPFEPRERDYAVVTSFYVFAVWVGLSVLAIYSVLKTKINPKTAAIVASLTLIAPILMGFQNWEDHDRSERRAAHDLAYNYLVNLNPNSILFVYGDNDTYPLWAIQETEQFRDDVKVVNYTLLGSPWNISQAKRKTYNADAIESQMTPEDYKQGVNEGIIVLDTNLMGQIFEYAAENNEGLYQQILPLKQYADNGMTAKEAMDFILEKNNPAKMALINELKMVYSSGIDNVLPTNKIIVPVNKQKVLENGIVNQRYADQIVPNLVIELKNRQIGYKNELFMLDVLANYDWDRSIYFSSGGLYDDVNIFYLNDYLAYEGFIQKLVPIDTGSVSTGETGWVDPLEMYEHIKNYQWSNFNDPNAYFDPTSTNNILTYRNAVTRTARVLIEYGEKDKAKEILDLLEEKIPYRMYPEGISLFSLVPVYQSVGETEFANELQTFLNDRLEEENAYYASLDPYAKSTVYNDIQRNIGQQQYAVAGMIDFYLNAEKDTIKAFEAFKNYYIPIETRLKNMRDRIRTTGFEGLSDADHEQLSTDLSLQRSILPYAMEIDSTYAEQKFNEMVDLINEIDPRNE